MIIDHSPVFLKQLFRTMKNFPKHSDSGHLENWTKYSTVPRAQERVSERASERMNERSGARERSEQSGASE